MKCLKDDSQGFSLVEILIVIAIIGVLASIAIPRYVVYKEQARAASCLVNRRNIETDEAAYFAQQKSPSLNISGAYQCPSGGIYVWLIADPQDNYYPRIGCSLHYAQMPALEGVEYDETTTDNIASQTETGGSSNVGENLRYRNVEDGNSKKNDFVDEGLITGDGDDLITVDDDVDGSNRIISTNDGDDTIIVGDDVQHGATIETGEGDDIIEIGGTLQDSTLDTGDGDDTINLDRIRAASIITTGEGDDKVTIDDVSSSFDDGAVSLEEGNDTLVLNDSLRGTDAQFDGGEGEDTLVLEEVSSKHWNRDIGDQFRNFESVTLKDGDFSLDENNNLI